MTSRNHRSYATDVYIKSGTVLVGYWPGCTPKEADHVVATAVVQPGEVLGRWERLWGEPPYDKRDA